MSKSPLEKSEDTFEVVMLTMSKPMKDSEVEEFMEANNLRGFTEEELEALTSQYCFDAPSPTDMEDIAPVSPDTLLFVK